MSEKELKERGLIVVRITHILITIILIIFGIGVTWGITQSKISDLDDRTVALEKWQKWSMETRSKQLQGMEFNIKNICEKLGVPYTEPSGGQYYDGK